MTSEEIKQTSASALLCIVALQNLQHLSSLTLLVLNHEVKRKTPTPPVKNHVTFPNELHCTYYDYSSSGSKHPFLSLNTAPLQTRKLILHMLILKAFHRETKPRTLMGKPGMTTG